MTLKKAPLALVAGISLTLAACTDPAKLGGENGENLNRNVGAGTGAVLGAALGAAVSGSSDKATGAIVGGVIGAAAGGLLGNQLDKQAAELNAALDDDILVETGDGRLIVTLPEDVTFDTDSTAIRPSLQAELGKVAASLVQYPDTSVQVIGHTDNEGEANYNQDLSERRASAVAAVLQSGGVSAGRISTSGRGENEPKASNLNPEGRAQNRRVEIVVIPNQS